MPPVGARQPLSPRVWVALAVMVVGVKASYLLSYASLPFWCGPVFDSGVYLRQAAAVRAGDFGHPTLLAFSPLYGYVLAAFSGPWSLILFQSLLGLANLACIARIAGLHFSARAAAVASLLYLGYGLLLFYESKVLAETLGLFLGLCCWVLCLTRGFVAGRLGHGLGAGVLLGLAVLARANLLFVAPLLVLASALRWPGEDGLLRPRLVRSAALALGVCLILIANGLWNLRHTGLFVPVILMSRTVSTASQSGWDGTLRGFSARADGAVSAWDVVAQARERLTGAAAGEPERASPALDLVGLIRQTPYKALLTFRDRETGFQYGYYGERSELPPLYVLPLSFGLLGLLSLAGGAVSWRRYGLSSLWHLVPWFVGALATTLLFHPSSRYRLPMVLPMIVLAAGAVSAAWEVCEPRRRLAALAGLMLLLVGSSWRTLSYELARPAFWHLRVAESAQACGDIELVQARLASARKLGASDPQVQQRIHRVFGRPVIPQTPP